MSRPFEVGGFANPVNLAWGLEYRTDSYETKAGDPESYEAGPVIGAPIGTQAGSGLKPEETVDVDRDAMGAYLDLESDITDRFQAGIAARFEDYSDFGSSVDGKISGRFELTRFVRRAQHDRHRLPRAVADAGLLPRLDDELRRGRPARERAEPADRRPDRRAARRERSGPGGVGQLQPRLRVHAGQQLPADRRLLPRRHRRPHHALRAHRRPGGHRLHRGPARHRGRARRALLHERDRHADGRLRHRGRLHARSRPGQPAALGGLQPERHRGDARRPESGRPRRARRRQRAVRRRGAEHDRDRVARTTS